MEESNIEKIIQEAIEKTPIGKKVTINFGGDPLIINVELSFAGGWIVTQTIIPGKSLEFTRGENQYLESITITMNRYDGLE